MRSQICEALSTRVNSYKKPITFVLAECLYSKESYVEEFLLYAEINKRVIP